jgi:YVTN family beta-propeller protein
VWPINLATNTAGKPIKVGRNPLWITITPNGKTAYVADYGSDTVTPINTATNKAGKPILVGPNPSMMAMAPSGKPSTSPTAERSAPSWVPR